MYLYIYKSIIYRKYKCVDTDYVKVSTEMIHAAGNRHAHEINSIQYKHFFTDV